jgi:EmrB/QacA subfamily drug resistance transporter
MIEAPPRPDGSATDDSVVREKWLLPVSVVSIGMFMALLDVTIVNVAMPAIQYDFGGSLEDILWIATAYTLTLGVVVPLSGWLGDKFGLTRLYIASVFGFALCSGLCGLAWNLGGLIAARILQAVPGGLLPVVCIALLYRIVPKAGVGAAMGIMGVAFVAAPAVGPVVGGYLVEYANWRLVFYINLPIGLLTVIAAWFLVPKVPKARVPKFDVGGFVTIALGLFALLLAASKGEDWGWDGYRIRMLLVGGVLVMALFVVIELHVPEPLLDLRLFGVKVYTLGVVIMAILQVNLLASSVYIPIFLQQGQGLEAFDAGLVVAPQALAMCVASMLAGQLYDRVGPKVLTAIGCAMTAWGNILLLDITADTTHREIIIWTGVRGFGMSMAAIPALTAAVNRVGPKRTNQATALENVAQQIPGAFGIAILGALLTSQQAQLTADRGALLGPDSLMARVAGPAMSSLTVITDHTRETFALLYRAASYLLTEVMARALSNTFLLLAGLTVVGLVLALLLPMKQPSVEDPAEPAAEQSEPIEQSEPVEEPESAEQSEPAEEPERAGEPESAEQSESAEQPDPAGSVSTGAPAGKPADAPNEPAAYV